MLVLYRLLTLCATFIVLFIITTNLAGLSPVGKFRAHFVYRKDRTVQKPAIEA